jgi:uncharacterized protein (TIGR02145 family)
MRAVTSPSTGSYLVRNDQGLSNGQVTLSYIGKIAKWFENDSVKYSAKNYGVLYNWNAAMDYYNRIHGGERDYVVSLAASMGPNYYATAWPMRYAFSGTYIRGICPLGWHITDTKEWTSIEAYLTDERTYSQLLSDQSSSTQPEIKGLANKMVAGVWYIEENEEVQEGEVADVNYDYRDSSDLSILPSGINREGVKEGAWAYFWTNEMYCRENNYNRSDYSKNVEFYYLYQRPMHRSFDKFQELSVRCVKDYDNKYALPARNIYYYPYSGNMKVGVETNPNNHVARRGMIYSTLGYTEDILKINIPANPSSLADPSVPLSAPSGVNIFEDETEIDADRIFEASYPKANAIMYMRAFLIYDDGQVVYGNTNVLDY